MPGQPEPPTRAAAPASAPPAPGRAGGRPHRARPGVLAAVGAGGAAGSLARHQVALAWPSPPPDLPWATLAVNVSGSLLLGALLAVVAERWPPTRYARPLAGAGFCGGYTTWSAFMTESALLVRDGRALTAAAYVGASLLLGIGATFAGMSLGRLWPAETRRSR